MAPDRTRVIIGGLALLLAGLALFTMNPSRDDAIEQSHAPPLQVQPTEGTPLRRVADPAAAPAPAPASPTATEKATARAEASSPSRRDRPSLLSMRSAPALPAQTAPAGLTAPPQNTEEGSLVEHTVWTPDREGIRNAIAESMDDFRNCYEQWLAMDPKIAGKIAVSFTIASSDSNPGTQRENEPPDARIIDVHLKDSNVDHVFMEGCVQNVFSKLRFTPPPDGVMKVTYPLIFASREPDEDQPPATK